MISQRGEVYVVQLKKSAASGQSAGISRFRSWIQAGAALLTNVHLPNFLSGRIYRAVVGSSKFSFSYYITGFLILFGVLLGRFICGFLCPFGWFQDLLHRIPGKKLSTKKLKPLTYLKYVVLLLTVCFLPVFAVNDVGMGDPFFCKYICPLGAFYAWMNRVSLLGIRVDGQQCISCGKCAGVCKMDVEITKTPDHGECIRCGKCINVCPVDAVSFQYGFGRSEKQ